MQRIKAGIQEMRRRRIVRRKKSREECSGPAGAQPARESRDSEDAEAAIEVSLSVSSEISGNLLRFNLPIHLYQTLIPKPQHPFTPHTLRPRHTLWDCGGHKKFVHSDLVAKLQAMGVTVQTRSRSSMDLTTAGRRERMPLREARLSLDIGSYHYCC